MTREEISGRPSRLLSAARNRTKGDVRLVDLGTEAIVLKDFGDRGFLVRQTVGRFSVSRECRAYARLAGVPGIPRFFGRLDPFALAWAFVPGRSLSDLPPRSLPGSFFDALDRLLAAVHAAGVAITDLHHRNVIVTEPAGEPALIDFSLALVRPRHRWNLPGRWLHERAAEIDRIAAARIRGRYEARAEGGAPFDENAATNTSRLYRCGRAAKRLLRRARGKR